MEHSTGTVTVTAMSNNPKPQYKNPGDVEFEVKYPEDYKGAKFMPEGRVTTSKESAELFTKQGIGKVVEEAEADPATETETETKPKGNKKKVD